MQSFKPSSWLTPEDIAYLEEAEKEFNGVILSPIRKEKDSFYFYDRDNKRHGPYKDYEYAAQACKDYAESGED